jgi:hypothetical protein
LRNLRLTLTLLVLACITAFFACNKYEDTTTYSNDLPVDKLITASLQGRVLDENGGPVQGAAVNSGTASTTTDANGIFTFSNIEMSSRFGFVKVTKTGYFSGSRSILADAGSSNFVSITLLPRTSKGSFPSASGGSVIVTQGDTVAFDGGTVVVSSTNATYSGTVHVFASYLDPTDKAMSAHMPGDLRGIGTDGKETLLQSFGMMVVELEGDAGERLQIASGKTATLRMAIPGSLQAGAPTTIPLWYFNDTTGKWMEQGAAARQGNNYVGQVSHFTWWNCDASSGTVTFKVLVKDQSGNPLAYRYMQFTSASFGTRSGYTDANGYASGLIPKGQILQLQIMNPCGSLEGGANIGPALTDQDLGTITVSETRFPLVINGTVADCNSAAVDSGYVTTVVDNMPYFAKVTKGSFSLTALRCSYDATSVSLAAGDYTNQVQGSPVVLTADTGKLDAGQLIACGTTVDQFVNLTYNSNTYSFASAPDAFNYNSGTFIQASSSSPVNKMIRLTFPGNGAINGIGTFTPDFLTFNYGNVQGGSNSYSTTPATVNVTAFGPVNGYISGTFGGTIGDSTTMQTYPLSGNFKIKRTN